MRTLWLLAAGLLTFSAYATTDPLPAGDKQIAHQVYIQKVAHLDQGGFVITLHDGQGNPVDNVCQQISFVQDKNTDSQKLTALQVMAGLVHAYDMRVDIYGNDPRNPCQANRMRIDQDF